MKDYANQKPEYIEEPLWKSALAGVLLVLLGASFSFCLLLLSSIKF